MSNEPYHNEGFGQAFLLIIFLTIALPILGIMTIDDTWDRFLAKYGAPFTSECWQNSKHERVCKDDNTCKFGRNFCTEEVFRWRAK